MDSVTAFIIGDPHFKAKNMKEGLEFVEKCVKAAEKKSPTFIVILGDTLDTHEMVLIPPHNLACTLIEQLSKIAHVYLIIGNHDLINSRQFLTNKHIFNPLKKWKKVTVVDKPKYVEYGEYNFVMCPYVPPGKFVDALNTIIDDGDMWDFADCIFAHQEFFGCKMGNKISTKGDKWDEDYPPVVSGHIHNSEILEPNIFYPGSALQHAFGESPNKRLWFLKFGENEDPPYFSIKKINLGMKGKKIVCLDIDNINDFDTGMLDKYNIKLNLKGKSEQFKVFQKGSYHKQLIDKGVKITYTPTKEDFGNNLSYKTRKDTSFLCVLKEIIDNKSQPIQNAYDKVLECDDVVYELVFHDSETDESENEYVSNVLKSDSGESEEESSKEEESEEENDVLEESSESEKESSESEEESEEIEESSESEKDFNEESDGKEESSEEEASESEEESDEESDEKEESSDNDSSEEEASEEEEYSESEEESDEESEND